MRALFHCIRTVVICLFIYQLTILLVFIARILNGSKIRLSLDCKCRYGGRLTVTLKTLNLYQLI